MAFYTAYFDESGHESAPFFTFGGLVLDVENPSAFESEWKAAIAPLNELHTSPFLAGGEGFEKWNNKGLEWKQEILRRAARVIGKFSLQTFSMTLDTKDFFKISVEQGFDSKIAYPYSFGARFGVVQVGHWSGSNSIPGRVRIVFERRHDEDIEETVRVFNRDHLDVPIFESKGLAPLQAADLIAYTYGRKNAKNRNFFKVKPAHGEINQMLHTNDNLGLGALRSIWNRFRPLVITRVTPEGERPGVYFESDMSQPRKPFRRS